MVPLPCSSTTQGHIHAALGISSLAELEAAAKDDRIKKAKRLGAAISVLPQFDVVKSDAVALGKPTDWRILPFCNHLEDEVADDLRQLPRWQ